MKKTCEGQFTHLENMICFDEDDIHPKIQVTRYTRKGIGKFAYVHNI